MTDRKRVVVAMSGGVDSSTAAALLKQQGHDVIGIGLRLPEMSLPGDSTASCCGIAGMDDARRVASRLDIPFYVLNYEEIFEKSVVDYFCHAYRNGLTPNPCVECNRVVKFGHLLETARALEADYVATGHYARACRDESTGRFLLKKGLDSQKDQTYFLYPLSQQQLSHTLFPLGEMAKQQTRQLAKSLGLDVHDKPGSQDICFVGEGDYRAFLTERCPEAAAPGPIVDTQGRELGRHSGTAFYTVGQRKGLGVAAGEPLYVLAIDPANRTVTVGRREDLETTRIEVGRVNWIAFDAPPEKMTLGVKVRYRQEPLAATVSPEGDARAVVSFHEPQLRAAAGQSAVFYDDDLVVGGGIIDL